MGVITVEAAVKTAAVVSFVLPLILLAVPFLDTTFVVLKRLKYRQPIYRSDSEHFHHRMARIGFSSRRTIAYLYAWTLLLAGLALALRFVPYSEPQRPPVHGLDAGHGRAGGCRGRGERVSGVRARDPQVQAPGRDSPAAAAPARPHQRRSRAALSGILKRESSRPCPSGERRRCAWWTASACGLSSGSASGRWMRIA